MTRRLALILCICTTTQAFVAGRSSSPTTLFGVVTSSQLASSSSTDDLLRPSYEIEPIAIRIGHGFDIHRMAPIEEAGQPIVIGGVEIPHVDQKVSVVVIIPIIDDDRHTYIILYVLLLILILY